jgi:hypothetical protein
MGFNEHHFIGLILIRDSANAAALGVPSGDPLCADDIEGLPHAFSLRAEAAFTDMPTTMLMDTIDALQCSWVKVLYGDTGDEAAWAATEVFVCMLFRCAGVFVGHTAEDDEMFNHIATTEIQSQGRIGMTQSAVRRVLDTFVVLFRHMDLYKRCEEVDVTPELIEAAETLCDQTFKPHALEATRDVFYKLCTYFDLPTGARLAYMHRFSGMYNCASQVAYFYNEAYQRRDPPKRRDELESAMDELPLLVHMYPEVPVVCEDECPKAFGAYWMLLSGRIYLIRADGVPLYDPMASTMYVAKEPQVLATSEAISVPDSVRP